MTVSAYPFIVMYDCNIQCVVGGPPWEEQTEAMLGVGLNPTLTFIKVFGNLSMNECSRPSAQWVPWRKRVILSLLWPVSAYPFIVMYDCDIQCVVTRQTLLAEQGAGIVVKIHVLPAISAPTA